MALWHRSIPHCAKCGAKTESKRAGRQRQCTSESCGARFRPRIEPSILVLVRLYYIECILLPFLLRSELDGQQINI